MIEPAKLYCPYCDMVLIDGKHENDEEAWAVVNCEYYVGAKWAKREPIKEIDRLKLSIKERKARRRTLTKGINKDTARIAELEALENDN